ncbi:MAG: biotin--[acetyl-CoA-carboxylase] ligase [Verrucomicrobiaceae bacterium]|nr:MAG: biotin--[acetyl-CoA-carboxylase] ligase [Verrucomicrobiaceae bacterium]
MGAPDRLIADDLRSRLGDCPLVRDILVFQETGSTNDQAAQLGRHGAEGGVAIFAEKQTAGRGRFGRRWESAAHRGLWFSLLLRPELPLMMWPRLTTWAALGVAGAVDGVAGDRAAVKWPNDVYLRGKKVAGILIETGTDSDGEAFAVLGIGVNVNHEPEDFPEVLRDKAGAIREATGSPLDRTALAVAILRQLNARWPAVCDNFSELLTEAKRRSFLLGRWVKVHSGETVLEGIAESLDDQGHLLLRQSDGEVSRLSAGEVTLATS